MKSTQLLDNGFNKVIRMKKHEMARAITELVDGVTIATAENVVDAFFEVLTERLAVDDTFNQKNFGTFKRIDRAARKGRNPQTREIVVIPPTKALKIVVSNNLKTKLNEDKKRKK